MRDLYSLNTVADMSNQAWNMNIMEYSWCNEEVANLVHVLHNRTGWWQVLFCTLCSQAMYLYKFYVCPVGACEFTYVFGGQ